MPLSDHIEVLHNIYLASKMKTTWPCWSLCKFKDEHEPTFPFYIILLRLARYDRQSETNNIKRDEFIIIHNAFIHVWIWFMILLNAQAIPGFVMQFMQQQRRQPWHHVERSTRVAPQSRPAHVFLPNWKTGRPAAIDLTAISSLHEALETLVWWTDHAFLQEKKICRIKWASFTWKNFNSHDYR